MGIDWPAILAWVTTADFGTIPAWFALAISLLALCQSWRTARKVAAKERRIAGNAIELDGLGSTQVRLHNLGATAIKHVQLHDHKGWHVSVLIAVVPAKEDIPIAVTGPVASVHYADEEGYPWVLKVGHAARRSSRARQWLSREVQTLWPFKRRPAGS